jgi:hypothetical protein
MYLHEEHYYLISNHAVARNTIFCDTGIQIHFKEKMKFYLEPICEILAYNLKDSEFQILVKLKGREFFNQFFQSKIKDQGQLKTPESTYIFSQAMSNLQNSLVKKFNRKYGRTGTLMAGRFQRELISSKERVIEQIQHLNDGQIKRRFSGIWAECALKRVDAMTSKEYYKLLEKIQESGNNPFWNDFKSNLVGKFDIPDKDTTFFKFHFRNRQLFNSICKHYS